MSRKSRQWSAKLTRETVNENHEKDVATTENIYHQDDRLKYRVPVEGIPVPLTTLTTPNQFGFCEAAS
jgi:hypothetical protein